MTLRVIHHSAGWPAAWRHRFALRALAFDIVSNVMAPPPDKVQARAVALVKAWRGMDSTALRVAERAFAAALFRHLAQIDGMQPRWMRWPELVRLPGRHGGTP